MGRAGAAVARAAARQLGTVAGRRVVALAGKGHNGGDALEALARLADRGAGAQALVTGDPDALDAQGRRCVALVRRAGGRVRQFDAALAGRLLAGADLVLDGLLGTGSSGAPRGAAAEAIAAANDAAAPVVAVDIPSGVDGASGAVAGEAVTAAVTVTFQAAKPGHVLPPGSERAGRLEVADIGLPLDPGSWWIGEAADLAGLVPVPRAEQHKRSRGVLLLVGGSPGMGGAPTLMGRAARRSGTGLLVLAVPASVADRVGAAVPEAITVRLPESGGGLAAAADDACRRWLGEAAPTAPRRSSGGCWPPTAARRWSTPTACSPSAPAGRWASAARPPWSPPTPASSPGSPPTPRAPGSTRPPSGPPAGGRPCC
jgi:ADP-dependent NAD(P)H-hydrate dehydratase / NAD(P)H-hydrate epimerase